MSSAAVIAALFIYPFTCKSKLQHNAVPVAIINYRTGM